MNHHFLRRKSKLVSLNSSIQSLSKIKVRNYVGTNRLPPSPKRESGRGTATRWFYRTVTVRERQCTTSAKRDVENLGEAGRRTLVQRAVTSNGVRNLLRAVTGA